MKIAIISITENGRTLSENVAGPDPGQESGNGQGQKTEQNPKENPGQRPEENQEQREEDQRQPAARDQNPGQGQETGKSLNTISILLAHNQSRLWALGIMFAVILLSIPVLLKKAEDISQGQ